MNAAYFNPSPISRPSDPITSHLAGREITQSGQRQTIMQQCLEYVTHNPGQTAGAIGEGTGLGHMRVERRLSDLKNKGKLTQGRGRLWNGRLQVTWWVVEEQLPLI